MSDSALPVLLRGGPRARWAYDASGWRQLCDSVRTQLARGQRVVDEVLGYVQTDELVALPNGEIASVWRWSR